MNTSIIANEKSVQDFVTVIRSSLQDSNKAWWKIALAFAEAKDMYGFTSHKFETLCKSTKFSTSTASKLIAIANSDRLKKYAEKLSAVQSWGTLYAIVSLTQENFDKLKAIYKLDDKSSGPVFLTQTNVDSIRRVKTDNPVFKNYAIIKVDEDALKGELLTPNDLEKLWSLINEIESITSYIQVSRTEIDEKEASKHLLRVENKATQITRNRFYQAITSTLIRHKKLKGEKVEAFERRCLPMSRVELKQVFDNNPKEAFDLLGAEFDQQSIYKEAESEALEVSIKYTDKYANKVIKRQKASGSVPGNNNSGKQAA